MTNKQLFKEAIAEAKSIREAAIINAKEALEESLTPQIKSLLAQRLAEMEEEDMEEEMLEAPIAEKKEDQAEEEESAEKEEAEGESEDEDVDVADMSVEDLKDLIRDLIGQVVDQDGDGDHDMDDHAMEEPSGDEAPADMMGAEDEEEIDLDELLAELSEQPGKKVNLNSVEIEDVFPEDRPDYSDAYISYAEYEDGTELTPEEIEHFEQENYGIIHDILMDRGMLEETADMSEALDPQTIEMIAAALGPLVIGGSALAIDKAMRALKGGKAGKAGQALANHLEKAGSAAGSAVKTGVSEYTDLQEALKTIENLRGNLQEVNLLNAKLLYVNKIFKSSKNLSESQKANIVATFDKATSAKEAQLVYESLKTTLNSQKPSATSTKITESRLGMASKPTGVTAKRPEIISEVTDAVKRMQKLAGIIK